MTTLTNCFYIASLPAVQTYSNFFMLIIVLIYAKNCNIYPHTEQIIYKVSSCSCVVLTNWLLMRFHLLVFIYYMKAEEFRQPPDKYAE